MLELRVQSETPIALDAAFTVLPGEILALVGPSGSGKSALLRVIAGLWTPRSGRIAVNSALWLDTASGVDLPAYRRRVGMVFQSYALFPHMTAAGNVAAALGHLPRAGRDAEALRLLGLVNLAELAGRYPNELSGGQQQRVAVARALARNPQALLLDEPFSAVDRATRERLYREVGDLRDVLNMPVILVTHDMDEAQMLADRMVVLHRGRSLQAGTPAEIIQRPETSEIARLVGLRNIFPACRDAAGLDWAGLRLTGGGGAEGAVTWVIPDGFIVLHRRDRPSRGERENPVPGTVERLINLGQVAQVILRPDHAPDLPLHFSVPAHVAMRNGLAPGVQATVSLLEAGIHVLERDGPG